MRKYFVSTMFGRVRIPTKKEESVIEKAANECTVAVFQALNKRLNTLGLCISIDQLETGK